MHPNDLEKLVQRARGETLPKVDVTNRVMATLRAQQHTYAALTQRQAMRSLAWFAASSALIAACIGIVAVNADIINADPWMDVLYAVSGAVL